MSHHHPQPASASLFPLRTLLAALSSLLLLLPACQEPVIGSGQDLTASPRPGATAASNSPAATGATLGGVVKNRETGALVNGATVRLDTRSTETDQAGFYQFAATPAGQAKLIVLHPNYQPYSETLTLDANRRIVDVQLLPNGAATPGPSVTPSATPPLILLPDGSTSPMPTPSASASASASASPSASASATPRPTATPAYDPRLDDAEQAEVTVKRRSNGLELLFLLQSANGSPVNWEWGQVKVEYFIADANLNSNGSRDQVTSGRTVINAYGEEFVVGTGGRVVPDEVLVNFVLTLPDEREIEHEMTVEVNG